MLLLHFHGIWLGSLPGVFSHVFCWIYISLNGLLTRYVKLRIAHAPGMSGTFSPELTSKETASKLSRHASRHVRHSHAVMHVGISNPQWRKKRFRHSRRMRNPQFYESVRIVFCIQLHISLVFWLFVCLFFLVLFLMSNWQVINVSGKARCYLHDIVTVWRNTINARRCSFVERPY